MTVSILKTLATLPSGELGADLDTGELSGYLGKHCNQQADRDRCERHRLRDELYRDGGVNHMTQVVDEIFTDAEVKALRKKWVKHARFNNALKRVVNELSTLYKAPATRRVGGSDDNQAKYKAVLDAIHMDEQALEINRLYNLHRALLVGFRVRLNPDGTREAVLDIATPSVVRAVLHPNDSKLVIGWLIRVSHRSVRGAERPAAWALWTDHERALLDDQMCVVPGSWKEHGFGVCPWVPVVRHPSQAGFWPGEEGEDLVAAQVAIWFANICMLKEMKSATNQTVYTGDTAGMARGQGSDTERPIEAPEGVVVSTVDMSMDLPMFGGVAEHVFDGAANNYGIAPAIRKHQGVQSAEAREVIRMPLREQRVEQEVPFRDFERRLARVKAAVLAVDDPEKAFDPDGWGMDFGDSQTPLTPSERQTLFEKARTLGLDNTVDYIMRLNPDLTFDQAKEVVLHNIEVELWRNQAMRPMQAISGGSGSTPPIAAVPNPSADPPQKPQDGGDSGVADQQRAS